MKIASAEDIGRIIKQKRKDDGLTLEEAAAVCGVSYAFLSALENGKSWKQGCGRGRRREMNHDRCPAGKD